MEEIDRELLVKYIQGKCTAQETRLVKEFMLQPQWQQALNELLEADFKDFEAGLPSEGLSTAWNKRFREKYIDPPARPLRRSPLLGYAAACFIMLGVSFYFFRNSSTSGKKDPVVVLLEKVNPRGQRSTFMLPDSTVVYLGAESRLTFPKKFGEGNREISLTGEAFFEISKDRTHPFIVHTGSIQTRVLGTSFKINAFEGHHLTVSVATGKVSVTRTITGTDTLRSLAVLNPGQEVDWDPHKQEAAVKPVDAVAVQDWRDGTMTFVAASLGDIAETLERWHNVKIDFGDSSIRNYHVSLLVKGTDPLTHTLAIMCNTTHLHYKMTGRNILITKKGGR